MSQPKQDSNKRPATKVTVAYLLLGFVWVTFRQQLMEWMVPDYSHRLPWLPTAMGFFFITITGWIIYVLVRGQQRNILRTNETLEREVGARTRDLENLNKELLAANEEFISTNEELSVTNDQLVAAYAKIKEQSDIILRQKDEQLNRVLDNSHDAIFSIDLTGQGNQYVSRSARTLFGEGAEHQLADAAFWKQHTHPDDHAVRAEGERELAATGKAELVTRFADTQGVYRWLFERHRLVYENNRPVRHEGIASDISQLRGQEETLKQYRENLDILFANTVEEVLLLDSTGHIVLFNRSFEHFIISVTGKVPAIGQPLWEVTVPERAAAAKELFQKALAGLASVVDAVVTRNNQTIVHELRYNPVTINGEVKYVSIISIDVTDRRRKEEQILKLSESLTDFQNAIYRSSIVSRADLHGTITMVNQNFVDISGYSEQELVGNNHRIINSGHHPKTFWVEMWKTIAAGQVWRGEVKNRAKDGHYYWVDTFIMPFVDEKGRVREFLSIRNDISRQKEFQERITTIARELANLIENANVPIFGVDRHGYINEWNKVAADLTGYGKNEVLERKWTELLHPNQHAEVSALLDRVCAGEPVSNYELPFLNRKGNNLVFLLSASPRRDIRNEIVGAIFVAQDLTELIDYRKGLEQLVEDRTKELKLALSKEKELVEMKSKFVSIASHEFRTPLTTITISNAFLRKHHPKMLPAEIERKLDNIDKQVHHMTYLLDDVLMIGKAEAGKLEVQFSFLNMPNLVSQLVDEVQQGSSSHLVEVIWTNEARKEIYSDEKLIRNILINLLTNAIKFSPEAERVQLTLGGDRDFFEIKVKDRGIGIPAHDLDKLFQSFQRGSNVGSIDGTGLGLSIVKKAVDLLEGTIAVNSQEEKGTEFIVRLPQK